MKINQTKQLDSTAIVDPLLDIRTKADKIMCAILGVHLIYCCCLASFYDTYTAFFMVGLPIGGFSMLLTWLRPGRVLTRMVAAATLMALTALAIHQAHGMIEMHFGFFALLAMLLAYRDWRVYIPATLVAAVHHISFNYLQEIDFGVFCFTKTGWGVVAVHVAYVVFEVTILVYMAEMMRREAIKADTLLHTSNDANNVLTALASRVHNVAGQFGTSVEQVAAGNNELSLRAEQQASTLEETAASMQQLTAAVKLNAENARQANALATGASSIASKGGQAVDQVVSTMSDINSSSNKIVEIISVIDSIAFQTNILALNAAVEAARAGEQGRGFAVVASEVRSLAARSAEAAKEIKILISDSVTKVDAGGKLVENAGKTMAELVSAVRQVSDIISQISKSSLEQSVGIEQVNQAVMNLEQATQHNVAVVEETSAAAESMREQATNLLEAVSSFNALDDRQLAQTTSKISKANALAKITKIGSNLKVGFSN